MKNYRKTLFKTATVIVIAAVLVVAVHIMVNRLGLVDGYDFGGGAYYYVDIPEFEKIVSQDAYKTSVPVWVHVVLFFFWGWLMWRLWNLIDRKSGPDGEGNE